MSTLHATAHGLSAGDPVYFNDLDGGIGLSIGQLYYVLADGLTADDFKVGETDGGAAVDFTTLVSGNCIPWPGYVPIADGQTGTLITSLDTPTAPTVTSALVSGIVRLRVTLNDTAEARVRAWEVQITHKYDSSGDPEWITPGIYSMPENSTDLSIPALGSTVYTVRVRQVDVYGNFSAFSSEVTELTVAGSDALSAGSADIANDVPDGIITGVKITDDAIEARHISANSVTANALAATIILASLIKTADTGRRIEIDIDGIRLFDADESLLVRIPTNGDPVYVKGEVNASSFISNTSAEFRESASLAGNAVMTVQNGISDPTAVPTLAVAQDYLALTSTPSDIASAAGIAYDSGAGTFWIAADPTQAGKYVAHEYDATTGALVRSISATGTLTTYTTTLGGTAHVSDSATASSGASDSQVATALTMPRDGRITKVSVYMAGYSGDCNARVAVWSNSNTLLEKSATFTAASKAFSNGNSIQYNKPLLSPLAVTEGTTYRVGFLRNGTDGFQWDRNDGSSKTQYVGDGQNGDLTGITTSTTTKPNVYITYEYDVDDRLETAPMIGVATDGTYVYTLDSNGIIWKYLRSDGSYVANSAVQTAITGTKANAGLFYDATAGELIITTTTGTSATTYPKFVRVSPSTLAVSSTVYSAAAGTTFDGVTDTFRGGARLADPLNGSAATYWVATTNAAYAYTFTGTTATQTANRDFGMASTLGDGLTHDGTIFRGWANATPTRLWKFTEWDWTTASAVYWVGYAWYDSAGTTHETALGPRSSVPLKRRQRLQVGNAAIPTGGSDDPDKVRIYMAPNASEPSAGSYKLQVTDALTARYISTYASGGGADGAGTVFPSGTPAELKSAGTGWNLKGSGLMNLGGTAFPSSPATNDQFYRTDLGLNFFYNGTRWLSTALYDRPFSPLAAALSATNADTMRTPAPALHGGSDIWIESFDLSGFNIASGTALSGSHKWVVVAQSYSGSAFTTLATYNIDSGANGWRAGGSVAIGALMGSKLFIGIKATKTGTPGNLLVYPTFSYRIVAT